MTKAQLEVVRSLKRWQPGPGRSLWTLAETPGVLRILTAWPLVTITPRGRPTGPPPKGAGPAALRRWLWAGFQFDRQELLALAGLGEAEGTQALLRLMGAPCLFPDGTIHPLLEELQ